MTQYSSRAHVRPMLILLDVVAILCVLTGVHELLRPDWPIIHANLQFPYYDWVLLGTGGLLLLVSAFTLVRMFSGKGVVSAEDIVP
ncbi:MAG: hypothetical protein LAT62_06570 [Natronospirillum sp.]|uniref:hypothetical protein n=1 Tax=Natronospirillum sp. TaxID=2812955 RepID=UPI0025FBEB26|nr:hypothetical protein [Natronospirillum sp.]MCH8551579.1 hypothetical protein [Natronospirillum sp.]